MRLIRISTGFLRIACHPRRSCCHPAPWPLMAGSRPNCPGRSRQGVAAAPGHCWAGSSRAPPYVTLYAFRRLPDSPTCVSGVRPHPCDMRFDVRLIHAECLCLLIQTQSKVVTNTVHATPVLYRSEESYRRIAVDEAHLEAYAEGMQLPAKAVQSRRRRPHPSLRRVPNVQLRARPPAGSGGSVDRVDTLAPYGAHHCGVPRSWSVCLDVPAWRKPACATDLPWDREERYGRRATALKEVFVCLQHESGEFPAHGCSRSPLSAAWL